MFCISNEGVDGFKHQDVINGVLFCEQRGIKVQKLKQCNVIQTFIRSTVLAV